MSGMTSLDWKYLKAIAQGKPCAATSRACQKKLVDLQYIVLRHNGSPAITGHGNDSLLRRKYNLAIPLLESAAA